MKLALDTEVLLEISLAIGEGKDLQAMTRRVLRECNRLLNCRASAILREVDGRLDPVLCLPRAYLSTLPQPVLSGLLAPADEAGPWVHPAQDALLTVYRLPGFGLLLLERSGEPLAPLFLRSFMPLAQKLAEACKACLLEAAVREQGERLALATQAANIGVWEWNLSTGTLTWDAQMHRLVGIDTAQFSGDVSQFLSLLHPEDLTSVQAGIGRMIERGERFSEEFRIIRPDGVERVFSGQAIPIRSAEGAVRVLGVNFDVTERRAAEIAALAARDAAERSNRAKSEFVANMSHEVRTPLNGILGLSALALREQPPGEQHDRIEAIHGSAESLLTIVNDVLDFSKIEAGQVEIRPQPFELYSLLRGALAPLAARAAAKGLDWRQSLPAPEPGLRVGDADRLRQVLVNLCDNAIKFTPQGGIQVDARIEPGPAGDSLRLSVVDSGIGIEEAQQARIFEAFVQADATITRRFGGTGLGLTICARLIGLMGGSLALRSVPGRGTTFELLLPLPSAQEAETDTAPVREPLSPNAGRALHLLVAEDHPINQKLMCSLLAKLGHTCVLAEHGRRALEIYQEDPGFDLVLMDMQMPEMDGLQATRAIRSLEAERGWSRVPIAAMTANVLDSDRQACSLAGMDHHLAKPLRIAELDPLLQSWARPGTVPASQG